MFHFFKVRQTLEQRPSTTSWQPSWFCWLLLTHTLLFLSWLVLLFLACCLDSCAFNAAVRCLGFHHNEIVPPSLTDVQQLASVLCVHVPLEQHHHSDKIMPHISRGVFFVFCFYAGCSVLMWYTWGSSKKLSSAGGGQHGRHPPFTLKGSVCHTACQKGARCPHWIYLPQNCRLMWAFFSRVCLEKFPLWSLNSSFNNINARSLCTLRPASWFEDCPATFSAYMLCLPQDHRVTCATTYTVYAVLLFFGSHSSVTIRRKLRRVTRNWLCKKKPMCDLPTLQYLNRYANKAKSVLKNNELMSAYNKERKNTLLIPRGKLNLRKSRFANVLPLVQQHLGRIHRCGTAGHWTWYIPSHSTRSFLLNILLVVFKDSVCTVCDLVSCPFFSVWSMIWGCFTCSSWLWRASRLSRLE